LQTVIIPEDKIEDYTKKLSELIDKEHINSWYCDFRNTKYHYVIFSDKVYKLDRTKKQEYINMRNHGIKIGIPEQQLPTFNDLPTNLLIGLLIESKKQTCKEKFKELEEKLVSSDEGYSNKKALLQLMPRS